MSESIHIDVNGMSIYGQHGEDLSNLNLKDLDASQFDSPLKISHSTEIKGDFLIVPQGKENALDCNCVSNVKLSGTWGVGQDNKTDQGQVITIKASDNVTIVGWIWGKPGRQGAHVQLGQHSDQGYQPTRNITLCLHHEYSNQKVNVVMGWVLPWTIKLNDGCKVLKWESFRLFTYVLIKWILRTILRIPKGVKGPSWF